MPVSLCARNRSAVPMAMLILCGCVTRFDPRADSVRASPDQEADHAYREARARFDIGDLREAESRFALFLEKYPNDPLAPSARLGEARAALGLGEAKKAEALLESMTRAQPSAVDEPTRARARYLLGMALHRSGQWQRARELLRPFSTEIGGEEAGELHAVLADSAAQLGEVEEALREYSLFLPAARPPERLYIHDRAAELVSRLPPAEGRSLLSRYGLEEPRRDTASTRAVGRLIGCVLPLSGKDRALGERALRGALLAADLVAPALPSGLPVELRVRDSGSDPARALRGAEELAEEGVAAMVGTPSRVENALEAPRSVALGVPLIELAPDSAPYGALAFQLVRSRAAGAEALARLATQVDHKRKLAVLAPDSAYGRAMAQAFVDAAQARGARVVADLRYPQGATAFVEQAKRIAAASPDGVFVPAPATELQLIAPQLASSGIVSMVNVKQAGRVARLYATADGIGEAFLQSTAKYLQGAALAPVFYPDGNNPAIAAFVVKYRAAYNEEPTSLDALAFDAVRALRLGLDRASAPSRAQVATALGQLREAGLTGELGFGAGGERAGAASLYVVDGTALRALAP